MTINCKPLCTFYTRKTRRIFANLKVQLKKERFSVKTLKYLKGEIDLHDDKKSFLLKSPLKTYTFKAKDNKSYNMAPFETRSKSNNNNNNNEIFEKSNKKP